jgi:hypothetical protein
MVQHFERVSLVLANGEEFDRALAYLKEAAPTQSQDAKERVAELKRSVVVLRVHLKAQITRERMD